MSLAGNRYTAVSTVWNASLEWREPKYHTSTFEPACVAAVRTCELAAIDAVLSTLTLPDTTAITALQAVVTDLLAETPPSNATIATAVQAVIDALALETLPDATAIAAILAAA